MNKYQITTMKKKETIVNTGLALFRDKGFTNVTIKEIAARANVSQVSIYNYFGSKEALFAQCAEAVIQDGIMKARAILQKDGSFVEKIREALMICSSEVSAAFANYFSEKARRDPALFDLLVKKMNQMKREIYREFIEYGKCEGAIDPGLSTDIILEFMDALNTAGGKKEIDKDELSQLYALFLYGLVGKP